MKNCFLAFLFLIPFYLFSQEEENTVERFFYRDSILAIEKWFGNDKLMDSLKTYYNTGELNESFYFKNGYYEGESYKFNKSGEKLTTWQFKEGNLIERTDHIIEFNKKNEEQVKRAHELIKETNLRLKEDPNDFKAFFQRASMRKYLGDYTLAIDDFKKIEKLILKASKSKKISEKMLGSIYDHLASIYQGYEMADYCIHYKIKALNASPKESRLYHNLGSYLVSVKSYRLGIEYLNKAIKMMPNHPFANWVLSFAYSDLEDYEKAMTCVNIAFKNEDDLYNRGSGIAERDLRTTRGFLFHKLGETDKGIADLEEALNINKDNAFALRNLGVIYYDLENYTKSCELLQKARRLGYIKSHDRHDLETYLELSCNQQKPEKPIIKLSNLPFVFPNPTKDIVSIANFNHKDFSYYIFNFESKLIQQGTAQNKSIDLSKLPSGLYILNIESNDLTHSFKVVKE